VPVAAHQPYLIPGRARCALERQRRRLVRRPGRHSRGRL